MKPTLEEISRMKTLMPTEAEMDFMDKYNPLTLFGILKKMEGLTDEESLEISKVYQNEFYNKFMIRYRMKKNGK